MTENTPILLIENDSTLAEKMNLDLTKAGYQVSISENARIGLEQAKRLHPALIAIDRALPGESALTLIPQLRELGIVAPILLLMSQDTVADRIVCLESGADDYFLKPYHAPNFLHTIGLYLHSNIPVGEQLRFGDLVLDIVTHRVLRNERSIELTVKEFELLRYLMSQPEIELTREQILENVWGYDFLGESNVIEVYVRYLRLKLEKDGGKRLIQTVRGVGYVLRD
ncbi:response regulator transcription factor NblR [Chamaesiphon sp. VAR_48_metabat_135_sub]|uniref:response regulator transcription factor NblR n=1 Tax=Chamaesiphon sp. VAR_48_metabat_135_sub TaxID=2964699 RepID=UPI00286A4773|nr:response regulator transcription factor [Chamaesiphon sp. VAR_48_metabat_135_sub]